MPDRRVSERVATTYVEHLTMARDLIVPEDKWITGTSALTENSDDGFEVQPWEHEASCWCAYGAVFAVKSLVDRSRVIEILSAAVQSTSVLKLTENEQLYNGLVVTNYNDTHTHKEVIALFNKAISMAEGIE